MYSCLLCSSAVNCIAGLSGFFVACELSCLAPYPFVSQESGVYIARRFPVPLPLQVPESACSSGSWRSLIGVPFRGRSRGGESERGRKDGNSEEGPLPFWCNFWGKKVILKSLSKNSGGQKSFMSDFSELWGAKGGQSRCFGVIFGTFFGYFLDYG